MMLECANFLVHQISRLTVEKWSSQIHLDDFSQKCMFFWKNDQIHDYGPKNKKKISKKLTQPKKFPKIEKNHLPEPKNRKFKGEIEKFIKDQVKELSALYRFWPKKSQKIKKILICREFKSMNNGETLASNG